MFVLVGKRWLGQCLEIYTRYFRGSGYDEWIVSLVPMAAAICAGKNEKRMQLLKIAATIGTILVMQKMKTIYVPIPNKAWILCLMVPGFRNTDS